MPVDMNLLAAFAAVARRRSFRAAAVERGVSPSTLSQQVRDLEAALDLRLLNRTTRSVAPTEAGMRLLERLTPALADIASVVDHLQAEGDTPSGTLRINAPQPAIDLVLAPLIGPFLAACPRVRLEIIAETAFIDIVAAGFDAGVRWGESLAQDMIAVPLGPQQRYVVVAAPSVVAAGSPILQPRDLLGRPCIRTQFPSGMKVAWEFERDGVFEKIDPDGSLVSTNIVAQLRACLDGVGFCATFEDYVREDIAAGRLVSVLDDWLPPFPGPYLYYPGRRHVPAPLRAFVDFVRRQRRGG
ncbi:MULTISPECIES: LysR substrate-binding domain-containing protein [Phyllobacteriaceae]|jgi:DNA-binding transcriptional LysR family regulator|uniref:Transcriptional regulator n=1 Tax=Mesorhizobium hungaricum TaxID=1566387 RepID=A0A1C2EB07_9HYPH|nr:MULTISPECIES: LysR substrate-binding domain-containing protein [Mesorhizobium]MBN9235252.1 LysR family transcriptional regulator [Mesorhizobium sp.]MDQ0332827.1 DNA-binding transcriptional LysR family regulator [Mesorhizobium sp. YL-MeA3-2017]OCX24141.1 transcriptional regulator [Mesorhizobium hungaricum]